MENVEEKIKGLLAQSFDIKLEEVTLEANLGGDLEMDSLEIVELVVALEKEFKIKIGDGTITTKGCVSDVVRVVREGLEQ